MYETISDFERTRIISARAIQLENGAMPMIKTENMTNSIDIATKEFQYGLTPLILIRNLPNGGILKIKFKPREK
jgi:DNA-directed RNA polymerase subunit K/omega